MEYKNFGGLVNIYDKAKLTVFGQSVDLSAELAKEVILGNGCVLPAATFDDIFDVTDVKKYPSPAHLVKADLEHLHKREKALAAWHKLRDEYNALAPIVSETQEPVIA